MNALSSVESRLLKDKFYCQLVLLCYFSFGIQNECYRYTLYIIKFNVNVVVNFFTPGYF